MILLMGSITAVVLTLLVVGLVTTLRSAWRLAVRIKDADERAVRAEAEAVTARKDVAKAEELRRLAESDLEGSDRLVNARDLRIEGLLDDNVNLSDALKQVHAREGRLECDTCKKLLASHAQVADGMEGLDCSAEGCPTMGCPESVKMKASRARDTNLAGAPGAGGNVTIQGGTGTDTQWAWITPPQWAWMTPPEHQPVVDFGPDDHSRLRRSE